jgi:RNA polymerase sigma-70 factor (ECF subfamily)
MSAAGAPRRKLDDLVPELYDELHRLAQAAMRRQRPDHTLQPTALVHEAYVKLAESKSLEVRQRPEFLALAARVMRNVLVDHARARRSEKRGGDDVRVTLSGAVAARNEPAYELVALDEALSRLEAIDGQQVRIIELRYLAGLSVEEAAAALEISPTTVKRESAMAKAWLYAELSGEPG